MHHAHSVHNNPHSSLKAKPVSDWQWVWRSMTQRSAGGYRAPPLPEYALTMTDVSVGRGSHALTNARDAWAPYLTLCTQQQWQILVDAHAHAHART
jgi:hypothetical protein